MSNKQKVAVTKHSPQDGSLVGIRINDQFLFAIMVTDHAGFPMERVDDLCRAVADIVGGTYVGEKA